MGMLDDLGRIWDASKDNPRPGLAEGLSMAADAAEGAQRMREQLAATGGVPQGVNGQSFNPFENMQGMAAATRGTGTVVSIVDTGEKFQEASIYDVTLDVKSDTHPDFQVVHRQMIAAAALGNWQPGKMLPVRFDPANLTQVTIG
ncbi:MAG: hypothetical protein KF727_11895 [Microbacteriaceae bacterium]|nr:hypothetical protein [Microbacteriaceae bacterium]